MANIGKCCVSFLVNPGWSPGIQCNAWALLGYVTYLAFHSWSIKRNVVYPFLFTQAEVLAFSIKCLCASGIYNILSFSFMVNIGKCCVSFLVYPLRRLKSWHSVKCLSISGIYNILSFLLMVNIGKCCYLFSLIQAEVLAFNVMPEFFWDI